MTTSHGKTQELRLPYQDYFIGNKLVAQAFSCNEYNADLIPLSGYPFGETDFPLKSTYHLCLIHQGNLKWFYDLESYSELTDHLFSYYSRFDVVSRQSAFTTYRQFLSTETVDN